MNIRLRAGFLFFCIFLIGCSPRLAPATPNLPAISTGTSIPAGLTQEQLSTLNSIQKVDDHPLYTMTYTGAYRPRAGVLPIGNPELWRTHAALATWGHQAEMTPPQATSAAIWRNAPAVANRPENRGL